jgi:hypothetical protein
VHQTRDFLQHKLMALCHLEEIIAVLDRQYELTDFLNQKVQAAIVHKNPYFRPLGAKAGA